LGEDQLIPPIPPPNIKTEVATGSVTLSWQGTGSDIDANYIVYRRLAGTDDWEIVASIPIEGNNRGTYAHQDTTTKGGNVYEYAIATIDTYKNESALSEIVTAESK
jgi:fibronectin type 3 domain-containing protein